MEGGKKMFVVKIGGSDKIDYDSFLQDLVQHKNFVLVHGGSDELDRLSNALGHKPKFVESVSGYTSRATDEKTMELFQMAYVGKMNSMIVSKLQKLGVNAVGLSGISGRIFEAKRKDSIKIIENGKKMVLHGDLTGKVEKVNVQLIKMLLEGGYLPVLTPPAISHDNYAVNVDGDRAAAIVAAAMNADELIIMSDVPGVLKDINDKGSLIKKIKFDEIDKVIKEFAKDRMKIKLLGAKEALQNGVKRVIIASASVKNPISEAYAGNATVIEM